jgi:hypothetical protein
MIYILVALIVLVFMFDTRKRSEEVEGSKNFYMSDGASKGVYLEMHANGMSHESLKKFVQLEDQFLGIERTSVSTGIPNVSEGILISNKIKETFPKYDFSYHTTHIKRISRSTS